MLVQAENLEYSYSGHKALDGLSFSVERGTSFALLGPNGSGKSTLFRLLSTAARLQTGSARIGGADLATQARKVRRLIGVVFQNNSLDRRLTVAENLSAAGALYGLSGARLRARISALAEELNFRGLPGRMAGTLSGGERRRVEIAKALLHEPPVLLLDEATAGLDPGARRDLLGLLDRLRATQQVTILFTTHLLDEAEASTRILLLHRGRAVRQGTPAELKARVGGDVVVFREPADGLAAHIRQSFGVQPMEVDGSLHVEIPDGHRFLAEALESFPGAAKAVEIHKPTLEDAFLHETGERLDA